MNINVGNSKGVTPPNEEVLPNRADSSNVRKKNDLITNSSNLAPDTSGLNTRETDVIETNFDAMLDEVSLSQITTSNKIFTRLLRMGHEEKIAESNIDNFLDTHENDLGGILFSIFITNRGRNEEIKKNRLNAKSISDDKIRNLRSALAEKIMIEIVTLLSGENINPEDLWAIVQDVLVNGKFNKKVNQINKLVDELCNSKKLKECGINKKDENHKKTIKSMIVLKQVLTNQGVPPEVFKHISDILGISIIIAHANRTNRHPKYYEVYSPGRDASTRFETSKKNGAIEYDKNDKTQKTILDDAINGGMFLAVHQGAYYDMGNAVENGLVPYPPNWKP